MCIAYQRTDRHHSNLFSISAMITTPFGVCSRHIVTGNSTGNQGARHNCRWRGWRGRPAGGDISEVSGTDNATEPPVGAVADPAVIMLEQWELRLGRSIVRIYS